MIDKKKLLTVFFIFSNGAIECTSIRKYVIGFWPGGIGVSFTSTLNHLVYCEQNAQTPMVYWSKDFYYFNPMGFNGAYSNVWEYYFEPVSFLTYAPNDTINHFYPPEYTVFSYYNITPEKRNYAYQLISKYIKLKPILQQKVDQFFETNLKGKKTIAIHIRGTDKVTEQKIVAPERMIEEALKYADADTQFFIATDEKKLLDRMLELLSNKKVVYYDCYRSEDGKPLHTRVKPSFSQLGEDVIVEMWLMSKCDMLIHTLSNVSSIPLYLNPELKHITLS